MSTIELPPFEEFLSLTTSTLIYSVTSNQFSGKLALVYQPWLSHLELDNQTNKEWRIAWQGYEQWGKSPQEPAGVPFFKLPPNETFSLFFPTPLYEGLYHYFTDITAWLEKERSVEWNGVLKALPDNDRQLLMNGNMIGLEGKTPK